MTEFKQDDLLIKLENIFKIYQTGEAAVHALDGVSLEIRRGEFVAIVGASGSGKSTCMNIIGCLDVPTSGSYHLAGADVLAMDDNAKAKLRNKTLGFIFQQYNLIPKLNLCENVELAMLYAGMPAAERHKRSLKLLEQVGLADKAGNVPGQLSGGQQQRVAIARSLIYRPALLLADEPTGNLDQKNSKEIIDMLKLSNRNLEQTILLITHDEKVALEAERIIAVEDGRIISDERKEAKPLS